MPPLIPIIVGIAIAAPAIGAVAAGAAFAGLAGSLILLGSSLILSGISRALIKPPQFADFDSKARERLLNVRQPAAARELIYGLVRKGGIVTFLDKRGANGEFLDVVLTLTGHEVEEIGNMYFDDVLVPLDASGVGSAANATGKFAGNVRVQKNLGADSQAALADLVTANSKWTSNHRQRGCAHVWIELKFNPDLFPSGVPQITFDVKGAKVFDTRTSTTAYSANAALCLRDYLVKTKLKGGAGIAAALIPDSLVDAAANLADEDVTLDLGGTEDRYTCNGTVSTAEEPGRIIQQLLSAMAGKLVFSGGQWLMYGAAWRAPTASFDEDDLVGPIKVESRLPRRELFNAVKGVIVTAANKWQPSDFPPFTNSTYETEDGERLWKDVDFPFTTSAATAQRLAKIDLETARQQKTVRLRMNLKALQVNPPDVIQLTVARFSWTNKNFEIAEQQLVWDDAGDAPALVVEMLLRETASTVYDWTAATDEDQPTAPETPTLPDPSVAAPPTGLVLSSFSIARTDGIRVTFLKAAWTAPADEFVTAGGMIEIEYKKNSSGTWLPASPVPGNETEQLIPNVDDDVAYDVRIRSVNIHAAKSAWVQQLNFTVVGSASSIDGTSLNPPVNRTWLNDAYADVSDRPNRLRRAAADLLAADIIRITEEDRLDALALINAPAEAGAEVTTGKSLTVLINRTLANIADTASRFAAVEAGANKTETRTAAAIAAQGALATLSAAAWSSQVSGRPTELTDERVATGLNASGRAIAGITNRTVAQLENVIKLDGSTGILGGERFNLANFGEKKLDQQIAQAGTSAAGQWVKVAEQDWYVPPGITSIDFQLALSFSGSGSIRQFTGGDNIGLTLAVTPGSTPAQAITGGGTLTYTSPPTGALKLALYVRTESGGTRTTVTGRVAQAQILPWANALVS